MKIVVIGGTGLIGSKLVAVLRQRGQEVLAASPDTAVNTLTGEGLAEALGRGSGRRRPRELTFIRRHRGHEISSKRRVAICLQPKRLLACAITWHSPLSVRTACQRAATSVRRWPRNALSRLPEFHTRF